MGIETISIATIYLIALWTSTALVCIYISIRVYRSLVIASDNMGITNHPLISQIKIKYENCLKHRLSLNDYEKFIEKQMNKYEIKGVLFKTIENMPDKMAIIVTATSVLSMTFLYYSKCDNAILMQIAFSTVGSIALIITLQVISDTDTKKEIVYLNIANYLHNYLKNRLEVEYGEATIDPEWSEAIVLNTILNSNYNEEIEAQIEQLAKSMKLIAATREKEQEVVVVAQEEEKIVQEILEEFFT